MGWISVILAVVSLVLSFIEQRKAEREQKRLEREAKEKFKNLGIQIKANTRSTNAPMRVFYGRHRVGGNDLFISTTGKDNNILYFAHGIGEGPNKGIVYDDADAPYIWFNDELIHEKFEDTYEFQEYYGDEDQTSALYDTTALIYTEFDDFTDNMPYTAFVAWKLTYDKKKYRGKPTVHYLYDGREIYNFKTSVTEWSDNPVLVLYDFLTSDRYGVNLDAGTYLDLDSWEAALDYCDDKNITCNMAVYISDYNVWEIIDNILFLFRGEIIKWDGKLYLKFKDLNEESSIMTIEDQHIVQDQSGKAALRLSDPGDYDEPKGIRVSFVDSENNYYSDNSFVVGEEDNTIQELFIEGCTDRELAGKIGTYELERRKLSRTISGKFRDDCLQLDPGDVVTFNTTALNMEDQDMRVISAIYTEDGFVDLTFEYENLNLYNDVYDIEPKEIYNTTLPDPQEPALIEHPEITETLYDERGRTFIRLDIEFDIPDNSWFDHLEVWVSTDGDILANYKHQLNATDDFSIDRVQEGETYYVILRTVNEFGVKQDLDAATKLTQEVVGKLNTPPPSLTYLHGISGDGSVTLRSTKLDSPDIEVYEFRLGSQWSGAIFLSARRSPQEQWDLVRPGIHTFWCNTKGTNGLYGTNPQDATVEVEIPNAFTLYKTFKDDFTDSASGQTFDNVEHLTYGGDVDHLKCSHTGGDLTGQYISEIFDTGIVSKKYYIHIDTEFVTTGFGTRWQDLFIDSTTSTWAQVNANNRSWKDMFEIEEAPQVTARIWYRETTGSDWNYIEHAEIEAAVIKGRYFRVELNITDPATNINAYIKEYILKLYT